MADERRGPENRPENRWETIGQLWKDNRWLYGLAGFLLGLVFFPALIRLDNNAAELLGDFVPEAVGITFTVGVLNRLADRRVRLEMKRDLIFRMGSSRSDVAVHAVEDLTRHGWLIDGSLKGANLMRAELQEARMIEANLRGANLMSANLQRAILVKANLQGVRLMEANLQEAHLEYANLQGADLMGAILQEARMTAINLQETILLFANLQGGYLVEANLQGADLRFANLQGANVADATFDEQTVLPDAEWNSTTDIYTGHWTPDTDMRRFTDPEHPDFWQPEWAKDTGD